MCRVHILQITMNSFENMESEFMKISGNILLPILKKKNRIFAQQNF